MIAIDTNILIRYVTRDEPEQFETARRVIEARTCFVPDTVVLEAAWVLESIYGFAREDIAVTFRKFFGLENVRVDDAQRLQQVVEWYEGGMDFGDAMHLALSQEVERLVTFDEAFIRRTAEKTGCRVVRPEEL